MYPCVDGFIYIKAESTQIDFKNILMECVMIKNCFPPLLLKIGSTLTVMLIMPGLIFLYMYFYFYAL